MIWVPATWLVAWLAVLPFEKRDMQAIVIATFVAGVVAAIITVTAIWQ